MLAKAILVLCLVWVIAEATALEFNENIKVNGGGKLISKTNAEGGKDMIFGEGKQDYTRNVSQDQASSSLSSNYSLSDYNPKGYSYMSSFMIKPNPNGLGPSKVGWIPYSEEISSNRYMIQMRSPKNMVHGIEVHGTNNLKSKNTISFRDGKVKTDFAAEGSGVLREAVVNFNVPRKPDFIADTEIIDSGFSLSSGLADSAVLGSEIDALLSWARAATSVPASVKGETPKIDLERGIIGSPTPTKDRTQRKSEDKQAQLASGAVANKTPEPFPYMNESESRLTTQSAPNAIATVGLITAKADQKLVTGDPWQAWESNQQTADILIMPLKNDPIPMAYIGRVAQFDYFDNLDANKSVDIGIPGYKVSDENGMRIVESEECNGSGSAICQDYTHISAPRFDAPMIWASPFAQMDRLTTPFIP